MCVCDGEKKYTSFYTGFPAGDISGQSRGRGVVAQKKTASHRGFPGGEEDEGGGL